MAKPYRKLRSAHKFEKKKRDHGSGASEAHPAEDGVVAERDSSVEMPTSPVSAAASTTSVIGSVVEGSTRRS